MLAKQNDLISKEKKINISPINYSELNKLAEDFGKYFVPQKELSAEQAFWLQFSNPISEQRVIQTTPVRTENPSELPKVNKRYFDIQKKEFFLDNDRLLQHIICQEVMNIVMHADSVPVNVLPANNICLVHDNLEIERLGRENDHLFELLLSQYIVHICVNSLATCNDCREMQQSYIHKYNENLVLKAELAKKEHMSFPNNRTVNNQNALEILEIFKINEWQAKLDAKDVSIANLKKHIESLKGKNVIEKDATTNKAKVIAPRMFKLYLEPLCPKVMKNRDAHIDYIKHTQENADILRGLIEHARTLRPLDSDLDSACKYFKRISEVLVYVTDTCPSLTKPSEKLVTITPLNKNKKVRFAELATSSSSTQKQHSMLNANSKVICATCNGCLFDAIHDSYVPDFVNDVNVRSKSKSSRSSKKKTTWKPTSKVSTTVGYKWIPTDKKFTIEGNSSSSRSKRVESNISNNSEPNQSWGSNVSTAPSSSLIDFRLSKLFSGKSKKHTHKPKAEDSIQEKIYLLHMDLCGLMRIQSINGRQYILVIVDDYSRFTWVKFLRSKDEVLEFNGVVERMNCTLVEATRIMLIFSKALLFLWAEAVATAYIGIFIGYALSKKAYRIYNKRTRLIIETIHVDFDELIAMASEQFSSGPGPQLLTPETLNSGLVPNPPPPTPSVPPTKKEWDTLFQPMFDEYFNPPPSVASLVSVVIAPDPADSTDTQPPVIPSGVEEEFHDIEVAHLDNDPFFGVPIPEPNSKESSSRDVIPTNVHSVNQPPEHLSKWTKDHSLDNVISNPSRPVSTRYQLQNEALFCYFDAFLSSIEPKNYKETLKESCWIEAIQEELNEFKRLEI
ncbi:retrovirus-related pol polyprotein from transposon TNT 1-94 [Tanacetum coccineum]